MKTPNPQQRQVIDDLQNNIILYASAGTGKTFTVANRVANMIANGVKGEEILCLTFTIKACNEMKEDIQGYAGEEGGKVQVSTIHGFCYRLICEEKKRKGEYADLAVCDEVDQEELLKSLLSAGYYRWKMEKTLREEGISLPEWDSVPVYRLADTQKLLWRVEGVLLDKQGRIFSCKEEKLEEVVADFPKKSFEIYHRRGALRNLVSELKHIREENEYYGEDVEEDYLAAFFTLREEKPSAYEGLVSHYARYLGFSPDEEFEEAMTQFVGRWIVEYERHLALSNLLDFDDLIVGANRILKEEESLAFWSGKYSYVTVDEMQDTSKLEYEVLKKIFKGNKVMLCGDFFQTIYGWRGSRPEEILSAYIQEFQAKIYMLSQNYRATKTLAAASFGYLKNTYPALLGRYCPEELQIESEEEGEKIFCYAFDNREQEALQIYRYLQRNRPEKATDVCVIARTNKYIAELASYFESFNEGEEDGLRFFTVEENFQFFKKPLVKDGLAVLKLALNPCDRVSMERLAQKFVKSVGIKSIEALRGYDGVGASITSFIDKNTYEHGDNYAPLIEGYHAKNLVIYDTETTGLDLTRDEIVQLSAIKINEDGEVVDTFDVMVEPSVPISEAAYKTHGFDLSYIRAHHGVTAKEALLGFAEFVKGAVLVGHNNFGYDKPLLARQYKENGLALPEIKGEFDTLPIAKLFYPELENYKLSTLCSRFSIVNECAHNALGDITATGKCLTMMIKANLLPTATERRTLLQKYAPKFEKFAAFLWECNERIDKAEELGEYIVDSLLLRKRYPTPADKETILDFIESLDFAGEEPRAFLKEYLKDAALSGSQMDALIIKRNKIPIITVHQAKGCEFKTVILAGADDGNFPSFAARQSGDEEEEKKVFYVAITRAKERLILTRALKNGRYEVGETPYFWALPDEFLRLNRAWKNGN